MVNLTINGMAVQAEEGSTIMEAAKLVGIHVPRLCTYKKIHRVGSCRVCVVEVEGARNLQASCVTKVREGMVVRTNTRHVRDTRRVVYDLIISDHPHDCVTCTRNQTCELQQLGFDLGVTESHLHGESRERLVDVSAAITRDTTKCVLCRRCVTACRDIQHVGAISAQNRGFESIVSPPMGLPLDATNCSMCGQCTKVCPTGALTETSHSARVWDALSDPRRRVVVQTAPAVRVALGEPFGIPMGESVTGRMATVLRTMGFDDVFDTDWGADLTIMEEGTELLSRMSAAATGRTAVLPMITSCSPGWIKHCEHAWPDELDHISSCKSPHMMQGTLIKAYYAEKVGVDPRDVYVVSVMPCTAKKYEIQRPEMFVDGLPNVDAVLTTRELARMIKTAGIDFANLPEGEFDSPMGISTGAADIFGVTGGVMEAALRTVYFLVCGRTLPYEDLHIAPIMGFDKVKEAEVEFRDVLPEWSFLEGVTVRVAVTSGLEGADILMADVAAGTSPYTFIEVMGCPGGCIAGGGQPRAVHEHDIRRLRGGALYREDEGKRLRMSHENPAVKAIYDEFLGVPCGELSHRLLHTRYVPRGEFNELLT